MSDLDEARDLLARWAAGQVTDPDVWAGRGPRLLAGLVAEVERLETENGELRTYMAVTSVVLADRGAL